jgi:hypothetical protein
VYRDMVWYLLFLWSNLLNIVDASRSTNNKKYESSPELIDGPSKYGEDECIVLSLE